MQVELRSHTRRFSFTVACWAFAAFYLYQAYRPYRAYRLASSTNLSDLQQAAQVEPSNADYQERLGRYMATVRQDIARAISSYKKAVQLNPYVAQYWLDLAAAYQATGTAAEQTSAVEHAVLADPMDTDVAWDAANFYLIEGNLNKALGEFGVVLANDPDDVDSVFELAWRTTRNPDFIVDRALPRNPDLYLSFLQFLIRKQQLAAAEEVWNRLIALNQSFSAQQAFPYLTFLLSKHEVTLAKNAWQQLATVDPAIRPYLPTSDNLVVNGGFEHPLLNGGFDWWFQPNPNAAVALETKDFYGGARSLSVTFNGQSVADAGFFQLIPVTADTDYEFSAAYKTQDLESANGPRFSISDPYTNESFFSSDDWLGTVPWKLEKATFRTGTKTDLLLLKVIRSPAAGLIRGKLWIDDLKLIQR